MTVKEKLLQEFSAAISATYGELENADADRLEITASDINAIARKVKFYLDLK